MVEIMKVRRKGENMSDIDDIIYFLNLKKLEQAKLLLEALILYNKTRDILLNKEVISNTLGCS